MQFYQKLKKKLISENITLVVVSKNRPIDQILKIYTAGNQRVFGENRVQQLVEKHNILPTDIKWHMIGPLQKNKVKYIVPFISLIHSVDSRSLIDKIEKEASKINKKINILLQVKITKEASKQGFSIDEALGIHQLYLNERWSFINIQGLMGMASNTTDMKIVNSEFSTLKAIYQNLKAVDYGIKTLSMGMSNDFESAISSGSNMIRIGSKIFNDL